MSTTYSNFDFASTPCTSFFSVFTTIFSSGNSFGVSFSFAVFITASIFCSCISAVFPTGFTSISPACLSLVPLVHLVPPVIWPGVLASDAADPSTCFTLPRSCSSASTAARLNSGRTPSILTSFNVLLVSIWPSALSTIFLYILIPSASCAVLYPFFTW